MASNNEIPRRIRPPAFETKEQEQARKDAWLLDRYKDVDRRAVLALLDLHEKAMDYKFVRGYEEGPVKAKHRKSGHDTCRAIMVSMIRSAMRAAIGYEDRGLTEAAQADRAMHDCRALHDVWARQAGEKTKYGY